MYTILAAAEVLQLETYSCRELDYFDVACDVYL